MPSAHPSARRRVLNAFGAVLTVSVALTCSGCASPASNTTLAESRAPDFMLGLTVFAPQRASGYGSPGDRSGQQPARYIVEPDGWMRAAVGRGSNPGVYPPKARWLEPEIRNELWEMVRATGLGSDTGWSPEITVESAETFVPPPGQRVVLLQVRAQDGRWVGAFSEGEQGSEPASDLADRLADLAWVKP